MKTINDIKTLILGKGWVFVRKNGSFYFQEKDVTKPRSQGRVIPVGTKDSTEAFFIINGWLQDGFPTPKRGKGGLVFWQFCVEYWKGNYEALEITKLYQKGNVRWASSQVKDFFQDIKTRNVTPSLVQDFLEKCKITETDRYKRAKELGLPYTKNKYLAPSSIRQLRNVICIPLQYAARKDFNNHSYDWIQSCRFRKIKNSFDSYFSDMVVPRDIFLDDELNRLQEYKWSNNTAKMMFILARATGMRLGEIRGLKIGCVLPDRIMITAAYNDVDLYKGTKTGQSRMFPISESLYKMIQKYISTFKFDSAKADDRWLFPNEKYTKPVCSSFAQRNLDRTMQELNIPKTRIIMGKTFSRTFHSLRHCKDMELVNANLSVKQISDLIGHQENMIRRYTNHFTESMFDEARLLMQDAGILR